MMKSKLQYALTRLRHVISHLFRGYLVTDPHYFVRVFEDVYGNFFGEEMVCPQWKADGARWVKRTYWVRSGRVYNELRCSYCGSAHADDFMRHVAKVIETDGDGYSISLADSRIKIYMRRPKQINADDGPLKFKTYHLNEATASSDIEKINVALRISNRRFNEMVRARAG